MQALKVLQNILLRMQKHCSFYILSDAASERRLFFCCALIEKIYAQGNHKMTIHCQTQEDAIIFNDTLWTYKDISFIPHSLVGEEYHQKCPIQIGWTDSASASIEASNDILILLSISPTPPPFHTEFEHIIEIVNQDPVIKDTLRTRYQHYRTCGYDIKTHTI